MEKYRLLKDAKLKGKRVLLRAGFDVPMEGGKVLDTSRIEAILPTMRHILNEGASLIIMAHQGRPKGGGFELEFSQKPLVPVLKKFLKVPVHFASSCTGSEMQKRAQSLKAGEVLLLENLRFDAREKKNDPVFARELASFADLYVNDAFTNCHRNHTSMVGVPQHIPAYMGLNLEHEVHNLSRVSEDPRRPLTLIISGAKMETKIPVVEHFLGIGDDILLGGAIANTFIAARGFDIGTSKYEPDFLEKCREMMLEAEKMEKADIHVPRDVVVASEPSATAECLDIPVEDVEGDMRILDIGNVTTERFVSLIKKAGMVVWNGPLGIYEYEPFSHATKRVAQVISQETKKRGMLSILGGGDTIDFHHRYRLPLDTYTFVSTGGGAMLEFISGKSFPALEILNQYV